MQLPTVALLANLPGLIRRESEYHIGTVQQAYYDGASACRNHSIINSWRKWLYLCAWITIASDLSGVSDPIPYLQFFTYRIRVSSLAVNGASFKNRTMEGCLRNSEQIFPSLGAKDPHLDILGKINCCLSWNLCAHTQSDPPRNRFFPVPISLLHECWRHLHNRDAHQGFIIILL